LISASIAPALNSADMAMVPSRSTRATTGMINSDTAVAGVHTTLNQPMAARMAGPWRPADR
jgi:hypothetical protein